MPSRSSAGRLSTRTLPEESRHAAHKNAGERRLRRSGMLSEIRENREIVSNSRLQSSEGGRVDFVPSAVRFSFEAESVARISCLVAVMKGLDRLFDAYSDDEADDDGGDVNEEVSPAVDGGVRRMDVEHEAVSVVGRVFRKFLSMQASD
jgi:hypothetical protein